MYHKRVVVFFAADCIMDPAPSSPSFQKSIADQDSFSHILSYILIAGSGFWLQRITFSPPFLAIFYRSLIRGFSFFTYRPRVHTR